MSRILPILFLLMGLAVATREIPELYNLMDDPSNDGQVSNAQGQAAECATPRVDNQGSILPPPTATFARMENLNDAWVVPARTGQDILRLVHSLRT